MSHGPSNASVTLYTADGAPVNVELVNGKYSMPVHDDTNRQLLEQVIVLLTQIRDAGLGASNQETQAQEQDNAG